MPTSSQHIRLWTDFDEIFYECLYHKDTILSSMYDLKCHFYVMEKFCDFFTLSPSDLVTTLAYLLMDNFFPCFIYVLNYFTDAIR